MSLQDRIDQLEAFINEQGLSVPKGIVYQLSELTDSNEALLPQNDIRFTDEGQLVYHPYAGASEEYRKKHPMVRVRKYRTGLEIIVSTKSWDKTTVFQVNAYMFPHRDAKLEHRILRVIME